MSRSFLEIQTPNKSIRKTCAWTTNPLFPVHPKKLCTIYSYLGWWPATQRAWSLSPWLQLQCPHRHPLCGIVPYWLGWAPISCPTCPLSLRQKQWNTEDIRYSPLSHSRVEFCAHQSPLHVKCTSKYKHPSQENSKNLINPCKKPVARNCPSHNMPPPLLTTIK